jgi:hypothetical protein
MRSERVCTVHDLPAAGLVCYGTKAFHFMYFLRTLAMLHMSSLLMSDTNCVDTGVGIVLNEK